MILNIDYYGCSINYHGYKGDIYNTINKPSLLSLVASSMLIGIHFSLTLNSIPFEILQIAKSIPF